MGGGASAKKYTEDDTKKKEPIEEKPVLTIKQIAEGQRTLNFCTGCGASIRVGCSTKLCGACATKEFGQQKRRNSKSSLQHDEDEDGQPVRRRSKSITRADVEEAVQSHSRKGSKANVSEQDREDGVVRSRRSSKSNVRGAEDAKSTGGDSGIGHRRNSKTMSLTEVSQLHADDPAPFADVNEPVNNRGGTRSSTALPEIPPRRSSRRASAPPMGGSAEEGGGDRNVARRNSFSSQRRTSTIGVAGEVDMGGYRVNDRILGEGKVGAEMGLGTVIGPGTVPGAVEIQYDDGTTRQIKTEHLLPALTPGLEKEYTRDRKSVV